MRYLRLNLPLLIVALIFSASLVKCEEMKEHAIVIMTASEIAEGGSAFVEFSTFPGVTVAQFMLSTRCNVKSLSETSLKNFKAILLNRTRLTLASLQSKKIKPGRKFAEILLESVKEGCKRVPGGDMYFSLASNNFQCQYQIQRIPGRKVGYNSSKAKGTDFFIFVTVFFE